MGEALYNETCENLHVINELNVPVLCMGLKNIVVSASPEGILVSDKQQSSYIKPFVNTLDNKVMFAEKSWGSFRVLDVGDDSLTIKVTLNPGHSMNYHSHEHRDEIWNVISGQGRTVVDEREAVCEGRRCDLHEGRMPAYSDRRYRTSDDRSAAGTGYHSA